MRNPHYFATRRVSNSFPKALCSIILALTVDNRAQGMDWKRAPLHRYCTFAGEVFDLMQVTCGPIRPCFGHS